MSQRTDRDPNTGKRVLRFVATTAVVVAPISFLACGGAKQAPETVNVVETTNVGREDPEPEEVSPEKTNVDHTADPHANVGPEEADVSPEEEAEGGGDEASPE